MGEHFDLHALQEDIRVAANSGRGDKLSEKLMKLARKHSFDPQVRGEVALRAPDPEAATAEADPAPPNPTGRRPARGRYGSASVAIQLVCNRYMMWVQARSQDDCGGVSPISCGCRSGCLSDAADGAGALSTPQGIAQCKALMRMLNWQGVID